MTDEELVAKLSKIKGIGPKVIQSILDFRNSDECQAELKELLEVMGWNDGTEGRTTKDQMGRHKHGQT